MKEKVKIDEEEKLETTEIPGVNNLEKYKYTINPLLFSLIVTSNSIFFVKS